MSANLTVTPIPLNIQRTNNEIVLSWTNSEFNLQSAPAVRGIYTNIPCANSPYPVPITGKQQFFRLKSN